MTQPPPGQQPPPQGQPYNPQQGPSNNPQQSRPPYNPQQPPQGQYGPGGNYPAQGQAATSASTRSFGVVGAVLAVIGAVLCVISFVGPDWGKTDQSTFSNLHDAIDAASDRFHTISTLYFGWLAWAAAALVFVVAILANLPSASAAPLRPIGFVLGLLGAGATFWALDFADGISYTDTLKGARLGFYLAVAGFLVMGIGALIGARRKDYVTTAPANAPGRY